MSVPYPIPSEVSVLPSTLGATIRATAEALFAHPEKADPSALLYAEKRGGLSCRTCLYAVRVNATHGKCRLMQGRIHLDEGCCAAWDAHTAMLHLYHEPLAVSALCQRL